MKPYRLIYTGKDYLLNLDQIADSEINTVKIGTRFIYLKNSQQLSAKQQIKVQTLQRQSNTTQLILPILNKTISLKNWDLIPNEIDYSSYLASLTSSSTLYREKDDVHLFIASPVHDLSVYFIVKKGIKTVLKKTIKLQNNVAIQILANLAAGEYTVSLQRSKYHNKTIAKDIHFNIAEYLLMPLSARLISTTLDAKTNQLNFELILESYQKPFIHQIKVSLIEDDRVIATIKCIADKSKHYKGQFALENIRALKLRISAIKNAQLTTEISLQGAEKKQREGTLISNLNPHQSFSLLAEPQVTPILGGYISTTEKQITPLIQKFFINEQKCLTITTAVNNLTLIFHNVIKKSLTSSFYGYKKAGETIIIDDPADILVVYIGGFVGTKAFENYTTFIKPCKINLTLTAPSKLFPREILKIKIACQHPTKKTQQVLLMMRDQRLIGQQPSIVLADLFKRQMQTIIDSFVPPKITNIINVLKNQSDININTDEEGYIEDLSEWTPLFAYYSAKADDCELTNDHWRVIEYLRSYFEEYQIAPAVRVLNKAMGGAFVKKRKRGETPYLYQLYPYGPARQACKYAGLPKPTGCIGGGVAYAAASTRKTSPKKKSSLLSVKFPKNNHEIRKDFPDLLYFDLITVEKQHEIDIQLKDNLATLCIEAFAIDGWDWVKAATTVTINQAIRVDLEVPLNFYEKDKINGTLHVDSLSNKAKVALYCDEKPVVLRNRLSKKIIKEAGVKTPANLIFDAKIGNYTVVVTDKDLTDSVQKRVNPLNQFKTDGIVTVILDKNQILDLADDSNYLEFKIKPDFSASFVKLLTVSANYQYLCCEQTAFKVLSATHWYLLDSNQSRKTQAKNIIITGAARLESLFIQTKGFAFYHNIAVHKEWSMMTAQHLQELPTNLEDFEPALQITLKALHCLSKKAAKIHQISYLPKKIKTMQDAYLTASRGQDQDKLKAKIFMDKQLKVTNHILQLKTASNKLSQIETKRRLAYAVATLFALDEDQRAILLLQQLLTRLHSTGMFYTTLDTAAAIPVFLQLHQKKLVKPTSLLKINHKKCSQQQALNDSDKIKTIEPLDSLCIVQIKKIFNENWKTDSTFPIKVQLLSLTTGKKPTYQQGEQIILKVSLPEGYQAGDLLKVSLPDALSWLKGGGQVKQFSLDFAAHDSLSIPLVVIYSLRKKQHFSLCVQNMFVEERASHSGLIVIN